MLHSNYTINNASFLMLCIYIYIYIYICDYHDTMYIPYGPSYIRKTNAGPLHQIHIVYVALV